MGLAALLRPVGGRVLHANAIRILEQDEIGTDPHFPVEPRSPQRLPNRFRFDIVDPDVETRDGDVAGSIHNPEHTEFAVVARTR